MAKALNQRHSSPAAPAFSGEGVKELYLNPNAQPGCGWHNDPECLCDVDLEKHPPVPLGDKSPDEFWNVETVEDLITVAASLWVTLDVNTAVPAETMHERDGRPPTKLDQLSQEELDTIVRRVREGASRTDLKNEGHDVSHEFLRIIRRALSATPTTLPTGGGVGSPKPIPMERLIELGDSGMPTLDVVMALFKETGCLYDQSLLRRHYYTRTGRRMAQMSADAAAKQKFPRERILEIHKANPEITPNEIRRMLAREGIVCYAQSIRAFLKRVAAGESPTPRRGKPAGWTKECGLSYNEYREKHAS